MQALSGLSLFTYMFLRHTSHITCLFQNDQSGKEEVKEYKRVAIVDDFFDIIYGVHVEMDGRGGKHAGQKRTYRAVSCSNYSWRSCLNSNEPGYCVSCTIEFAPSEDSDQPAHPRRLIRVSTVRRKTLWVLGYPQSTLRELWSNCADSKSDVSFRRAHMHSSRKMLFPALTHFCLNIFTELSHFEFRKGPLYSQRGGK